MQKKITMFKSQKPKTQTSKTMSIDLAVGGERDEIQQYQNGNDAGNIKTNPSTS